MSVSSSSWSNIMWVIGRESSEISCIVYVARSDIYRCYALNPFIHVVLIISIAEDELST